MSSKQQTLLEQLDVRVKALEDTLGIMSPKAISEKLSYLEQCTFRDKEMLTLKEACVYLNMSESLIYKLTADRKIPHFKPRGKLNYFLKSDLDQWMRQGRIATIYEENNENGSKLGYYDLNDEQD